MAAKIDKGTITEIIQPGGYGGHPTRAKVNPLTNPGAVTAALTIPWHLRGKMGNLAPGVPVAFIVFDDATGIIIDRMDGEWAGVIDYNTETTGDVKQDKTLTVIGNVTNQADVTTTGLTTSADLSSTGGGTSYNSHTHTCPECGSETSTPN